MEDKLKNFIEKAKTIHGDGRYDYSNVIYKNVDTKVEIKCNTCGTTFFNTPYRHINQKRGCVTCVDNAKRKTTEQFIKESEQIHGKGRYLYDKTVYINGATKVILFCTVCNEYFEQTPQSHTNLKCGCNKCRYKNATKPHEDFIKEVTEKYPDYDFGKTEYKKSRNTIKYFCKICNEEKTQLAASLLRNGCPDCSQRRGIQIQTFTKEEFVEKAVAKHGDLYDYTETIYVNHRTHVNIKCNRCNKVFSQLSNTHLLGGGCPACNVLKPMPVEEFIERSEYIHGTGKFDYSLVHENYKNNRSLVKIKCNKCGKTSNKQINAHIRGHGCKFCNNSKGEEFIAKYLTETNVNFEREHKIEGCKHKRLLKFDFYLPEFNACIEFDGEQHFRQIDFYGEEAFVTTQLRDGIKNKFCENHNIPLLRIKFDETNIGLLLEQFIATLKQKNSSY